MSDEQRGAAWPEQPPARPERRTLVGRVDRGARSRARGRKAARRDRALRRIARHARLVDANRHCRLRTDQRPARERQRRDGGFEATKSRTFNVPLKKLFTAFSAARTRRQWLEPGFTIRSSTALKRMRVTCTDKTVIQVGFFAKGSAKSMVAIQHQKLPDRSAVAATKMAWAERFERLSQVLS
jgi:hypothetical protein